MAKLKFKDENNEFIPVVQDVKVNGVSVFDGKDANITIDDPYVLNINRQSIPEHLKIPDDGLAYIREKKTLSIIINTTNETYNFVLRRTDSSRMLYECFYNLGSYSWYTYVIEIDNSDTYASGCDVYWVGSTTVPGLPIDQTKTYVLKAINGTPVWVVET